jgi:hypothetical protein
MSPPVVDRILFAAEGLEDGAKSTLLDTMQRALSGARQVIAIRRRNEEVVELERPATLSGHQTSRLAALKEVDGLLKILHDASED